MEIDVEVGWVTTWLLVAFFGEGEVIDGVHARLDLHLFIDNCRRYSLAVQSHQLLLERDGLDAAVIQLFQSAGEHHLDCRHRGQSGGIGTSKCSSKKTALNLSASLVADIEEGVVSEEEVVEN